MAGHVVRLIPSADKIKVQAVRYAFQRFAEAALSYRQLAIELDAKGFPSPRGRGWTHTNVIRMLGTRAYVGTSRWGAMAWGKYHQAVADETVPVKGNGAPRQRRKAEEETIAVKDAFKGIIDPALFDRVQKKMVKQDKRRAGKRREFPLSGLIVCEHCGKAMIGETGRGRDRQGKLAYTYLRYVCATYGKFGPDTAQNKTCGHHAVPADLVAKWLVEALQREYLGPGRAELVADVKRKLKAESKSGGGDVKRLEKRVRELDQEVSRLVKAVRTCDLPELLTELADTRAERERVKAELASAGKFSTPADIDAEAERIVDGLREMVENLDKVDPATLRELFGLLVSRISCRWERLEGRKRNTYRLVEGKVIQRELGFSSCLSGSGAHVSIQIPVKQAETYSARCVARVMRISFR